MSNWPTGKVCFVSSGPGDPKLMTLKAVERLQEADIILFDELSATPALAHAGAGAELLSVGKRAGKPSPRQDHVSRLLVDYAQNGLKTVRLKSGDCSVFGRLEEEQTVLRQHGIDYEVVPGVSSATAAAAAIGIPLTRRLSARRVQFITGHDVTGRLPDDVNLAAIADPAATTVVFMGKRTFSKLADMLLGAGMTPDTPTCLVESVSLPEQKIVWATLGSMTSRIAAETGDGPVVILLGPLAVGS